MEAPPIGERNPYTHTMDRAAPVDTSTTMLVWCYKAHTHTKSDRAEFYAKKEI